ncbi:hypothetical protein FPV67DRAFT_639679 [Lyophyllum atratum]|nr:hypothetical protein FPV67DRAFT_639679 [Lyophyllum atratum]
MPAAHDVYADQLRELRRGYALYYPEPHPEEGPVEIGDVGFTKQGAFYRLFNVSRPPDDPAQRYGVPEHFERLDMGVIRTFDRALEPGPLHSKTVSTLEADIGTPGVVLPVEASFRFNCTSKRGAILMLETQMMRQDAVQDSLLESYLQRHCLSWHAFARSNHITVGFGDLMLVTECSKTGAWSSAVYSNNVREFGLGFSIGAPFLPSAAGISASASVERVGPVERRRSEERALPEGTPPVKNHTIFLKAYRLGIRQTYYRSMVYLFMKTLDPRARENMESPGTNRIRSVSAGETSQAMIAPPPGANALTHLETFVLRPDPPVSAFDIQ